MEVEKLGMDHSLDLGIADQLVEDIQLLLLAGYQYGQDGDQHRYVLSGSRVGTHAGGVHHCSCHGG